MGAGRGRSRGGQAVVSSPGAAAELLVWPSSPLGKATAGRARISEGQRQDVILAALGPGLNGAQPGPEAEPLTQDKSYFFVSSKSGKIPGLTKDEMELGVEG